MENNMQRYVLGFIFNESMSLIGLDVKKTPDWQANKFNGFGGKMLPGEKSKTVMINKFLKEANFQTKEEDWILFADILGLNYSIDCLYTVNDAFFKNMITGLSNTGSEKCVIAPIRDLYVCYNAKNYVPHTLTLINHAIECVNSGKGQDSIPYLTITVE
jgi:hypothetical protein